MSQVVNHDARSTGFGQKKVVKERPVLFSGSMVKAILWEEKPKWQTRRILRRQPSYHHWESIGGKLRVRLLDTSDGLAARFWWDRPDGENRPFVSDEPMWVKCPFGKKGDHLWVRETFCLSPDGIIYRATEEEAGGSMPDDFCIWKPSIFMFRKDSRITLEVTDVRVQRLNDISEEDALAEGVQDTLDYCTPTDKPGGRYVVGQFVSSDPIDAYAQLWDSINGEGAWNRNPFVWAVSFSRIKL